MGQHYKYLLIGGGMTSDSAIRGIRGVDGEGTIGLIGAEPHPPYNRPPLSKALWQGRPFDKIWRSTGKQNVDLHLGRRVTRIDAAGHTVTDDQGEVYGYNRLLIATGGTPRRLPFGDDSIIYYRTVEDYRRVRALADRGDDFVVIGSGFIGSEMAAALNTVGKRVTMVYPEQRIGERIFPADLSSFVTDYYRQRGIELLSGYTVAGAEQRGDRVFVRVQALDGGAQREISGVGVVAGLGIQPNIELAKAAGLEVANGVVVDASLRTSQPDIYAAGDVAEFYNPILDQRQRVEHEDAANTMGQMAGQAMAGKQINYRHLAFFYSDLFDLGYEAVGELDARLDIFADWEEPFRKGIVYYLREGRLRGILLWNNWGQVDAARQLMEEPGPFRREDLQGRLPAA